LPDQGVQEGAHQSLLGRVRRVGVGARQRCRGGVGGGLMAHAHKNRRAGLVAFGAVQILLGCGALVLLFRVVAAQAHAATGLLLYSIGIVYFFATGVGSIRGRRWARALIAAVSGAWAACGVAALAAPLLHG